MKVLSFAPMMRVAVLGAGPAGLYGAEALAKNGVEVHVFEKLFAPTGLVRYGVAPDHQKIKKTTKVFERILSSPQVHLWGNVEIGVDLQVPELLPYFDQVLIATGCEGARSLGIEGEQLSTSYSATDFVNWYNGHPEMIDLRPVLAGRRAVIIGLGNVAIDVARILSRDPDELQPTDITDYALDALRNSDVREVRVLARRGADYAACDVKELRQLSGISGVSLALAEPPAISHLSAAEWATHRGEANFSCFRSPSAVGDFFRELPSESTLKKDGTRRVIFRFWTSPAKVLGAFDSPSAEAKGADRVTGIEVRGTRLDPEFYMSSTPQTERSGIELLNEFERLPADILVRAVGYRAFALPGVPFDAKRHIVPNEDGRVVCDNEGAGRIFVAGWIKRGPSGLIGTNRACAVGTVKEMNLGDQVEHNLAELNELRAALLERGARVISESDWSYLSEFELSLGQSLGKVREKILGIDQALELLDGQSFMENL